MPNSVRFFDGDGQGHLEAILIFDFSYYFAQLVYFGFLWCDLILTVLSAIEIEVFIDLGVELLIIDRFANTFFFELTVVALVWFPTTELETKRSLMGMTANIVEVGVGGKMFDAFRNTFRSAHVGVVVQAFNKYFSSPAGYVTNDPALTFFVQIQNFLQVVPFHVPFMPNFA